MFIHQTALYSSSRPENESVRRYIALRVFSEFPKSIVSRRGFKNEHFKQRSVFQDVGQKFNCLLCQLLNGQFLLTRHFAYRTVGRYAIPYGR